MLVIAARMRVVVVVVFAVNEICVSDLQPNFRSECARYVVKIFRTKPTTRERSIFSLCVFMLARIQHDMRGAHIKIIRTVAHRSSEKCIYR